MLLMMMMLMVVVLMMIYDDGTAPVHNRGVEVRMRYR